MLVVTNPFTIENSTLVECCRRCVQTKSRTVHTQDVVDKIDESIGHYDKKAAQAVRLVRNVIVFQPDIVNALFGIIRDVGALKCHGLWSGKRIGTRLRSVRKHFYDRVRDALANKNIRTLNAL